MKNSTDPESNRPSFPAPFTLGLMLIVVVFFLVLFVLDNHAPVATDAQEDGVATAYPVGTSQSDVGAAYPVETLPSYDSESSYPAPDGDDTEGAVLVEEEILLAAPNFGIVVDESFSVLHVEPGGGADSSGLDVGDTLVSIGGVTLTPESVDEAKQQIRQASLEEGVEVVLIRNGETIQLRVIPGWSAPLEMTPTPVVPPQDYL